jgi:hypothetical protein
MPGQINSGDWTEAFFDDFPVLAGSYGWTSTVVTNETNTSTTAALMSTMGGAGGVSQTLALTGTGVVQQQLLTLKGLGPSSGVGLQIDFNCMIDTALSTATNSYQYFIGVSDGTTNAANFVGLITGFNPVANAVSARWGLAVGTLSSLAGSASTAMYSEFGNAIVLDKVQVCRVKISPDWKTIQGFVNGVASSVYAVGSPFGGSASATITPITTGGLLTYGVNAITSAAQTAICVIDCFSYSLIGRPQFS